MVDVNQYGIRNSRVYYNTGDKIIFKNWRNGLVDVNQYGQSHLYQLWKIPYNAVDGWGAAGDIYLGDSGWYKQFTWDGGENLIRDWRAYSIYFNTNPREHLLL